MEEKELVCQNCGAKIEESYTYCPYCGSINIVGAEKEYFDNLNQVKSDLKEMGDDTNEEFKSTVKSSLKIVLIVLAILVILGSIGYEVYLLCNKIQEYTDDEDYYDMQYDYGEGEFDFSELDAMFEAGDYDALVDYYYGDDNPPDESFNWEHFPYIDLYMRYYMMLDDLDWYCDILARDDDTNEAKTWVVFSAIYLIQSDVYVSSELDEKGNSVYGFSKDEVEEISAWADDAIYVLEEYNILAHDEWITMLKFFDDSDENHEICYDTCEQYLKDNNYIK